MLVLLLCWRRRRQISDWPAHGAGAADGQGARPGDGQAWRAAGLAMALFCWGMSLGPICVVPGGPSKAQVVTDPGRLAAGRQAGRWLAGLAGWR